MKSLEASSRDAVDLTDMISAFASAFTCRAAFGKAVADHDGLIASAIAIAGGFTLADLFPSRNC